MFIIHGKDDKINDPEGSKIFMNLITIEDKRIDLIDNCRHSVFNETDEINEHIMKETFEWLSVH